MNTNHRKVFVYSESIVIYFSLVRVFYSRIVIYLILCDLLIRKALFPFVEAENDGLKINDTGDLNRKREPTHIHTVATNGPAFGEGAW